MFLFGLMLRLFLYGVDPDVGDGVLLRLGGVRLSQTDRSTALGGGCVLEIGRDRVTHTPLHLRQWS